MSNSIALKPPGPSVRTANRRGRSDSICASGPGSSGNSHEAVPGPVATASQTASGVAGSTTSRRISNSLPIGLLLLVGDARVQGHDQAVGASTDGAGVVVLGDEGGDRLAELAGECRSVG